MKYSKIRPGAAFRRDEHYMEEALRLAKRGQGKTHPNPMVGAVVIKNGRVIGRGYHIFKNKRHAETVAIDQALNHSKSLKECSMYVTLEPCSTWGRTGPCVDAILQAGIRRVVIGCMDTNPHHRGRAVKILKANKIRVVMGILEKESQKINEGFLTAMRAKRPFVILKSAMSLDGKIATATGASRYISSVPSRRWVQRLRGQADAILVGARTVLADNPRLTCRGKTAKRPVRIVLDGRGTLLNAQKRLKIFYDHQALTMIFVAQKKCHGRAAQRLTKEGVKIIPCPASQGCEISLSYVLRELAKAGIYKIVVEGGGETMARFWDSGFVDRFYYFIAPKIIGGRAAPSPVEGNGVKNISQALGVKILSVRSVGKDILIEGEPVKNGKW